MILVAFAAAAISPTMMDVQMGEELRYGAFDLTLCHFVRSESVAVRGWPPYLLRETALYVPSSFVR